MDMDMMCSWLVVARPGESVAAGLYFSRRGARRQDGALGS
jgi:hypothetical protein